MHIMKNKITVIIGLFILVSMTACKKWVDHTEQPLEVDESKVFSTEKGFREALNGIYLQMGSDALYGKDLTIGVLSLAGRSYDSVRIEKSGVLYYQAATLNLKDESVKKYASQVWDEMYFAIVNINNLLQNIETRKSIFTGNNYNVFKGEALALRAYLHFDLLRLFSSRDTGATGIPYVSQVDFNLAQTGTVGHTLDLCFADLTAAINLLEEDHFTTSQISKWSVKGLLARMYLYQGDTEKANTYALDVINSRRFTLSNTNSDLLFTNENLFKLYIYSNKYIQSYKSIFSAPFLIGLSVSAQHRLFGNPTTDYRKSFIDANTGNGSGTPLVPKKFNATASNIFPMIRLTELYYIAAECAPDVESGLGYINLVRTARNLANLSVQDLPDLESLSTVIMNEYQKEFLGEGQTFFYYKRKNTPFEILPFYPKEPAIKGEVYLPVVPDASYSFVKPE